MTLFALGTSWCQWCSWSHTFAILSHSFLHKWSLDWCSLSNCRLSTTTQNSSSFPPWVVTIVDSLVTPAIVPSPLAGLLGDCDSHSLQWVCSTYYTYRVLSSSASEAASQPHRSQSYCTFNVHRVYSILLLKTNMVCLVKAILQSRANRCSLSSLFIAKHYICISIYYTLIIMLLFINLA